MPRRNFLVILISAAISLACFQVVDRNPYGRYFSDIMGRIDRLYVRPVDDRRLFDLAVNGMLKDLDEHSDFYDPRGAAALLSAIEQHYAGVGIEVNFDVKSKKLLVMGTLVGSPAYRADILIGDQILKVDDTKIGDLKTDDETRTDPATRLIRGPVGSTVRLTLLRRTSKEPLVVTLKRADITTDSVFGYNRNADDTWNYWMPGQPGIAYIRLSTFGDRSADELRLALESLEPQKLKGLVLDLRFNGGGALKAAIEICSLFVPKAALIATTRGRDDTIIDELRAIGPGAYQNFPLVLLVNSFSASASEITAACLQDHQRAVICGQRSYGKGTVQRVLDLGSGVGTLKLTIATYWRPSNQNIHRHKAAKDSDVWGVMPDEGFAVPLSDSQVERMIASRRPRESVRHSQPAQPALASGKTPEENPTTENSDTRPQAEKPLDDVDDLSVDPQLKRAVEYLRVTTSRGMEPRTK